MNVEQLVDSQLEGETTVLGDSPSQCHFVHYRFRMT
jgi:hypothetical protein